MSKKGKRNPMLIPTLIMGALAAVLFIIAWLQGGDLHVSGTKIALKTTLAILPLLFFAFIVAGLVQVLLPKDLLSHWVGDESGKA